MQPSIQQSLLAHTNLSGVIPGVSELWDSNARLIDQQVIEMAKALLEDGYLGSAPDVSLSGSVLSWGELSLLIGGVVCRHPEGNTNDSTVTIPIAPVIGVGNARIDVLVMEPALRLDAANWPQGMGVVRLVRGAEAPFGSQVEPEVTGMVLAKVLCVQGSAPAWVEHAVPKAAPALPASVFARLPGSTTIARHASGAMAGLLDYVEHVTSAGTHRSEFSYVAGTAHVSKVVETLSIDGFELKRKETLINYDANKRIIGVTEI